MLRRSRIRNASTNSDRRFPRVFSIRGRTTLTLAFPGTLGGANWSGASFDPSSHYLFVNLSELGTVGEIRAQPPGSPEEYLWTVRGVPTPVSGDSKHYPCQQPPWGTLNAVNLDTGKIVWKVPLGVVDDLEAKGVPKTGLYNLGGSIVTAGGLVFIAAASDRRFRAFDARTGKELWVTRLESNGHATPPHLLWKQEQAAIRCACSRSRWKH